MQTTESIKRRIEELEEQRKLISKEIRQLKTKVWNREHYKPSVKENSIVRSCFGKAVKDLTPSERKQYNAIRQAESRKRRAEKL